MPRLLHIEDDPANRLLVRKLLKPAGFEVVDAVDGLEGIRKATEGVYDLVLVDIAIPGLDGYEVTLRLRSEAALKDVPIVAITAEGNRDASLAVGCDGFLQKPIDARSFVRTVEGYLKGEREGISAEKKGEHLVQQSQRIVGHLEEQVAALSAANERLVELNQARKEFYRNISHELSTPMTPIVGYTKLLVDQELGPLTEPQKKAVNAINSCVSRLRSLIDNLLDVTGIETGRLRFADQPFDLRDCVEAAISETGTLRAKKNQTLHIALIDLPALPASGDEGRVTRAIAQLLENASKFSPQNSEIGIRVEKGEDGSYDVLVFDQGPGISEEHALRVFEPFFQIDGSPTRSQGGTGVGLAVARGVARGHGGELTLVSPCDEEIDGVKFQGACFCLKLSRKPRAPLASL
jgi:signal transduction histidine kinase